MPRGIPNMPEGYMTPSQAARRCGQDVAWIWKRLDPAHEDMIPHRKYGTEGRPTYQIPIAEFEAWDAAHEVNKR